MNSICIKTKIYFGENSLKRLEELKNMKICIICDEFLVKNGSVKAILNFIERDNQIFIFNEVVPEPPVNVIGKGVALIKKHNPDIVIAFGGGSAIDTAKGIIYFARQQKFVNCHKISQNI